MKSHPVTRVVLALASALLVAGAATAADAGRGPAWNSLSAVQKQALAPLQRDWPTIDPAAKDKWLEVAARFDTMPAAEQHRVRVRMTEWTRLTPGERARARLQFQEMRQLPAEERAARWQAYQALTPEERQKLAQQARPAAPKSLAETKRKPTTVAAGTAAKRNLIQPSALPQARAVAPTVVQARPGATTTTMSTRAVPPPHHQTGLPKIAATSGFVDPATLLPKRGPQGAAVRAAASGTPSSQP